MYCPKCGNKLIQKVKCCTNCGADIDPKAWTEDLVLRAQHEDVSAWEEIYQMTYAKAYSTAIQIVKDQDDAMDMLQDAYVLAFKNIGTLKDGSKVSAWISRIVANQCKNWLKKKNRVVFMNDAGDDPDSSYEDVLENEHEEFMPEESVDYSATKELMQGILDRLSDEQRLCVLMFYYNEMSVNEIAETLECSSGTVKSRLNYARKYIKAEVEALEKKGTKLYNIAPIPFIIWMLRGMEHTYMEQSSRQNIWDAVKKLVGAAPAEVAAAEVSSGMSSAVETAAGTAASAAAKAAGHAAVRGIAGAGMKHIAIRATAGVVAAVSVAAGGSAVYLRTHPYTDNAFTETLEKVPFFENVRPKPSKEELQALQDKIDYKYLESLCSYLPEYDSVKDLSEEDLNEIYDAAFAYCFEGNYDEQYHTGEDQHAASYSFTNRQIIPSDQIVTEKNQTVTFKVSAFDMFDQITGIETDPESLNCDNVKYDGEEWKGTFEEPLDNNCTTRIISKEVDETQGNVLVSVEKKDTDPGTGDTEITRETVVVALSDNELGYRIERIEDGYMDKVQKVESIAESLEQNSDDIMMETVALGDFSADSDDVAEQMDKLAYRVALTHGEDMASQDDDYMGGSPMYKIVDKETMEKYFDLAGIGSYLYENGINSDTVSMSGGDYQVYCGYQLTDTTSNKFLRTEINPDKGEVYLYYIGYHYASWGDGYDDFRKGTVTLVPADNEWGYQIKSIVTTAWTDEYAQEIQEMEEIGAEILNVDSIGIIEGGENAWQQYLDYYTEKMNNIIRLVEEKYPEERLTIERNQAAAWKQMQQDAETQAQEYHTTADGMLPGLIENRIYYLVGNLLMEDQIDVLK